MATNGGLQGTSVVAFTRKVLASDGLGGFYRGLTPSLISVMPYFAVRFGVYDILKRWHVRISDGTYIRSQFSAVYGFAAGLAAVLLSDAIGRQGGRGEAAPRGRGACAEAARRAGRLHVSCACACIGTCPLPAAGSHAIYDLSGMFASAPAVCS